MFTTVPAVLIWWMFYKEIYGAVIVVPSTKFVNFWFVFAILLKCVK